MKLTFEQIQEILQGAAYTETINGALHLYRFTKEQNELYRRTSAESYKRSLSTSGIRLEFSTNSPTLSIEVEVVSGSSRNYFSHDIYVNGTIISSFGSQATIAGIFSHTCALGDGDKDVCIYFPWSAASAIRSMELADGSTCSPITKTYKMLMYGDSITQGYDAALTSHSYASRLTARLNADSINRGIGGERFFPDLAELSEETSPDIVTVAYGTNDWKYSTKEAFEQNCSKFFRILSQRYPQSKIFAISPIWRANPERITDVGEFFYVRTYIQQIIKDLPNVVMIDGYDFVPHDPSYFADLRVHPNDEGFAHYATHLYEEIKKYL